MPDKLENSWGWYAEGTTGKVKCLLCEASFAKKGMRMLSHLGYEGPCGVRDKDVSLCRKTTPEIRRLFHECGGTFPLYPERVEVPLSGSSGTPRVGDCMHCGRIHQSLFIRAQVLDRYRLKSNGHKRMRGKPIKTLQTQWNMLLQWSELGDK
jgi:hypothetical protein